MTGRGFLLSAAALTLLAANMGCAGESASAYPVGGPGQQALVYEPRVTGPAPVTEVRTFTPQPGDEHLTEGPPPGTMVITAEPREAPPPPKVVLVKPRMPGPGYAWQEGHWVWQGGRYVWVPGRWALPPRRGGVWAPPRWRRTPRGYVHVPGHWR